MRLISLVFAVFLAACAALGTTPEAQIDTGGRTARAATQTTTAALSRSRITTDQAQVARDMLRSVEAGLKTASKNLVECRKRTGSTSTTQPDPCQSSAQADINLVLGVMTQVETFLKEKE